MRGASFLLILSAACVPTLYSQSAPVGIFRPDRGFQSYGSYLVSEIESINEATGGLNLRIPLAQLTPGRGGLAFGVDLIYNSQLFDLRTVNGLPGPGSTGSTCTPGCTYPLNVLAPSLQGGWQYGYNYALVIDQYPLNVDAACNSSDTSLRSVIRVSLVLPDGSMHMLRRKESPAFNEAGYDEYGPDGKRVCDPAATAIGPVLHYYTTDGSFLQVTVNNTNPNAPTWTAVFSDGKYVSGTGVSYPGNPTALHPANEICDRNANCVAISNVYATGGPRTDITDSAGHLVQIKYLDASCQGPPNCTATVDEVSKPGALNSAPLVWKINWTTIQVGTASTPMQYACYSTSGNFNACNYVIGMRVVDEVELPSGNGALKYKFLYADASAPKPGFGEIRQIRFPNGKASEVQTPRVDYEWKFPRAVPAEGLWIPVSYHRNNAITKKTLTSVDDLVGTATPPQVWTFEITPEAPSSSTIGTITNPDGGIQTNYFTTLVSNNCGECWVEGPLKYKTQMPKGTVIEQFWQINEPWIGAVARNDPKNVYVRAEYRTPAGGSQASATVFSHDKNGNLVEKKEYDWISSAQIVNGLPTGTVLRTTTNQYSYEIALADAELSDNELKTEANAYWNNFSIRVKGAATRVTVSGAGNTPAGVTHYTYDNAQTTANVMQEARWDSVLAPELPETLSRSNSIVWDGRSWNQGNLLAETDPDGHRTTYIYGALSNCSGCSNLYPTSINLAVGRPEARSVVRDYDFYSGLPLSVTENGRTNTHVFDRFGRLLKLTEAGSRVSEMQYDDANRRVQVRANRIGYHAEPFTDPNASGNVYDFGESGQLFHSRSSSDSGPPSAGGTDGIAIKQGEMTCPTPHSLCSGPEIGNFRYTLVSVAHLTTGDPTMGWIRRKFDLENRLVEEETFAGALMPKPWGGNSSSLGKTKYAHVGNQTTVTDPAERTSVLTLDGLGRLKTVAQGGLVTASYTYNQFDSPETVEQADTSSYVTSITQTRTFTYSSLNRLIAAQNPESGLTAYEYFPGGTLKKRTDARDASMTVGLIDGLKRVRSRSYAGGPETTPSVTYCYDGEMYRSGVCAPGSRGGGGSAADSPLGRLTGYGSQVDGGDAAQNFPHLHPLGWPLKSVQRMRSNTNQQGPAVIADYPFIYARNVSGALTSVTYPSGKIVNYSLSARDLPTLLTKNAGGPANMYASGIQYEASGAMKTLLGSNNGSTPVFTETWNYNAKGQMTGMSVTVGSTVEFGLTQDFGTQLNNGNLWARTVTIPGSSTPQYFRYDNANRLRLFLSNPASVAGIDNSSTTCAAFGGKCQRLQYDGFSNLWQLESVQVPALKQNGSSWYLHTGSQQTESEVNNRLVGQQYDAAGNLEQYGIGTDHRAVYDGEGRIVKVLDSANGSVRAENFYDGEGLRILKKAGGVATRYIYDADRQLMAEYQEGGAPTTAGVQYLIADDLGSTRVVMDSAGVVKGRYDYAPFGALLDDQTVGGVKQLFTGKERDAELVNSAIPHGLDYFGARYFSAGQGRFSSPDKPFADQRPQDPQSWNMYGYVRNNPLAHVDSTGEACTALNNGSSYCQRGELYANFDALVHNKTRFFAAASAATQQIADVAVPILGRAGTSERTRAFLASTNATLEQVNTEAVGRILSGRMTGSVPELDAKMVHLEQTAVQKGLNDFRRADPTAYGIAIKEINALLNGKSFVAAELLGAVGRLLTSDGAYGKVLGGVRKNLGHDIDFENQKDREAIGNALVKYIHDTGGCDVTDGKARGCGR